MRRRISWVVGVGFVLLAVAGLGARAARRLQGGAAAASAAQTRSASPTFGYRTEQEWVVWDVTRAIAQMAAYAKSASASSAGASVGPITVATEPPDQSQPSSLARFTVTLGAERGAARAPMHVAINDHLWAPDTYVDLARTLFGQPKPSAAAAERSAADTSPLAALTDLRVEVLLAQSARVSTALTHDVSSPDSHEEAALLIGALVLREAAGPFDDVRSELSQMTAHLAIARVLRNGAPDGLNATMARIVLLAAVGRQRDAVSRLDALSKSADAGRDPARAWISALRLRVTGDWRALLEPTKATLLERFEYARAVNARLSSSRLLDYLDTFHAERVADWTRIGLSSGFSIEAGHRFSERALQNETDEATIVWRALHEGTMTWDRFVDDLNTDDMAIVDARPGKPPVVRVLGWHLWGPFFQRHLCAQLVNAWRRNNGLGARVANETLPTVWEKPFGKLRLYPIVLKRLAWQQPEYERALTGARELVRLHPELVTAENWHRLREKPTFASAQALPFPEQLPWFTPFVPDGTAFDLKQRTLRPGCPQPPMIDAIDRWASQAPYELWTMWCAESQHATSTPIGKPTLETRRAALGPLAQYDLDAVMRLHDHAAVTADEYLQTSTLACQLDQEKCDILADHLIENAREEEAARTFESWIEHARDRVGVSNHLTWLVRYDYDIGKRARALEIAQMAADTYSARGTETLAHLFDRMGRYDEAEQLYRRISEQYVDDDALAAFYVRQARRTKNAQYEERAKSLLLPKLFPNGLEPGTLADFKISPRDGLAFRRFAARAERIGLREHDVLVSIDGIRMRNIKQYYVVTRLSHDDHMTLVVWRDGRYQQLQVVVPQRYFSVVFYDYHPARTGTGNP